jgi:hypothetical protein
VEENKEEKRGIKRKREEKRGKERKREEKRGKEKKRGEKREKRRKEKKEDISTQNNNPLLDSARCRRHRRQVMCNTKYHGSGKSCNKPRCVHSTFVNSSENPTF